MVIPDVIRELLESGVHFGHLSKHWNPKMKKFIFGKKKNIYIIDLEKTAQQLDIAREFVRKVTEDGKQILFVATKKQLRDVIREQALSCGMSYVVERWIGGFLTNFATVRSRVKNYIVLKEKRAKGEFDKMPGKEVVRLNREMERMERNYSGVTALEELPGCIFVIDPKKEIACVREANKLSIPIVALIDTDANPEVIDYPIPGNDDAIKSVRYITASISAAIQDGRKEAEKSEPKKEEAPDDSSRKEEEHEEEREKEQGEEDAGRKKSKVGTRKRRQSEE